MRLFLIILIPEKGEILCNKGVFKLKKSDLRPFLPGLEQSTGLHRQKSLCGKNDMIIYANSEQFSGLLNAFSKLNIGS